MAARRKFTIIVLFIGNTGLAKNVESALGRKEREKKKREGIEQF
jgi:hypothetical protein